MSKIIVEIQIETLPKAVLKDLLSFCKSSSLKKRSTINEIQSVSLEFLYNYDNEMSEIQSDAIVYNASKHDVDNEINERV